MIREVFTVEDLIVYHEDESFNVDGIVYEPRFDGYLLGGDSPHLPMLSFRIDHFNKGCIACNLSLDMHPGIVWRDLIQGLQDTELSGSGE